MTTSVNNAFVTGPDKWIQLHLDKWRSINLKAVQDIDWKPGAVILWLWNDEGIEIPDVHSAYPEVIQWLHQHGVRLPQ